jgi:hypothetical protein
VGGGFVSPVFYASKKFPVDTGPRRRVDLPGPHIDLRNASFRFAAGLGKLDFKLDRSSHRRRRMAPPFAAASKGYKT